MEGTVLTATVAGLETTLAVERTCLEAEAAALADRLSDAMAAALAERGRLEADKAGLQREAAGLTSRVGSLEESGAAQRAALEGRVANLDAEIAQLTISGESRLGRRPPSAVA